MMTSARLPLHTTSFSGNNRLPNLMFLATFVAGIVVGNFGRYGTQSDLGPQRGTVFQVNDIPFRNTSHLDDQGRPIVKQQLIEPFAIPNFVGVSIATFQPGQTMMPVHEHKSLHEFFYVLSGQGIIQKDGVDHKVSAGTFLHMAPYEKHGIWIPKDSPEEMKMLVCGVTVGSTK